MENNSENTQSQANELEDRLINFAVRITKLSVGLPKTAAGKHVAGQILRSGTSPAPNHGEAPGCRGWRYRGRLPPAVQWSIATRLGRCKQEVAATRALLLTGVR